MDIHWSPFQLQLIQMQLPIFELLMNELLRLSLFLSFVSVIHGLLSSFRLVIGEKEAEFYLLVDKWTMRAAYLIVAHRFIVDFLKIH